MDRIEELRKYVTKTRRGIEIGPYHSPIVPKRLGFNSISLDFFDFATLKERAAEDPAIAPELVDHIEEPDLTGSASQIAELVQSRFDGEKFDYIVSSHNLEHIPNPIRFLRGCQEVLKPGRVLSLALPDHRCCFDYFRPVTSLGEWLEAYFDERDAPTLRQRFDFDSLFSSHGGKQGWTLDNISAPILPTFTNDLEEAYLSWRRIVETKHNEPYRDVHCWAFTPASFQLLIEQLAYLDLIRFTVSHITGPVGIEFFVHLEYAPDRCPGQVGEFKQRRQQLSYTVLREVNEQVTASAYIPPNSITNQPAKASTIGVIIPLYNGERWIDRSLQSVFAQTRPPDEVIVVNDGSTDGGPAIVSAMAEVYPIRLLQKQNEGQSSARNHGVKHSTASLIAFLDQDDIWYARHLERLEQEYHKYDGLNFGWSYSNLDRIDEQGRMVCKCFLKSLNTSHPINDISTCLQYDMFVLPSAALISRQAFDKIGGFDTQLSGYEDDDLFLRLFRAGYEGIYVDEALSQWRIFPSSSSYTFRMARSRRRYAEKLVKAFPDSPAQNLFYGRDLIAPRFIRHATGDLTRALWQNDRENFKSSIDELAMLTSLLRLHERFLWKISLLLISNFLIARAVQLTLRLGTVGGLMLRSLLSPLRSMTSAS